MLSKHSLLVLLLSGLYSEGTSLFAHSQRVYGDLLKANRLGFGFTPLGYGVGSVALVDVALRCCAQGKFGSGYGSTEN